MFGVPRVVEFGERVDKKSKAVGLGALLSHPSSKAAAEPQVPDADSVDYICSA